MMNTSPQDNTLATRHSDMVLDDPLISLAAKGLFVSISYLGNKCKLSSLNKYSSDRQSVILSSLDELLNAGYVKFEDGFVSIKPASTFGVK